MSKKAKSAAAEKRRRQKRQAKEAMRAKFKAFMDAGHNHKSKRFRANARAKVLVSSIDHQAGEGDRCGNIGCGRCGGGAGRRGPTVATRRGKIRVIRRATRTRRAAPAPARDVLAELADLGLLQRR